VKNLLLFVLVILTGCTSTNTYKAEPSLNESNSATIYFYRTDVAYNSLNPEKPFFYLDNKLVAKLRTGSSIKIFVTPGEHALTSKESFMFLPNSESGRVLGLFEAGRIYYVRYSKEFSHFSSFGVGFVMSDTSSLKLATKQQFIDKS
jgi:hypothetical protein